MIINFLTFKRLKKTLLWLIGFCLWLIGYALNNTLGSGSGWSSCGTCNNNHRNSGVPSLEAPFLSLHNNNDAVSVADAPISELPETAGGARAEKLPEARAFLNFENFQKLFGRKKVIGARIHNRFLGTYLLLKKIWTHDTNASSGSSDALNRSSLVLF